MRKSWPGDILFTIIQHDFAAPAAHSALRSNHDLNESHLRRVEHYSQTGKYGSATLYKHNKVNNDLLMLPSLQLACDLVPRSGADYVLTLEDDAIVCDPHCADWILQFHRANADCGLFKWTAEKQMVNAAYYVATPEYHRKLSVWLKDYKKEPYELYRSHGSQLEHYQWRAARRFTTLPSEVAIRHHPYQPYSTSLADVKEWCRKHLPGITEADIALLDCEFH
jgi:hypothetical protein